MNLVVFDIDGTLVQYHRKRSDQAFTLALSEVFGVSMEDNGKASWYGFISSTDSGVLREIIQNQFGRSLSAKDVARFKQSMTAWLEKQYGDDPFEPTHGASRAWSELLKHSEWKVAVATGNWEFVGRYKLESAGFDLAGVPLASADDGESREQVLEISRRLSSIKYGFHEFNKIVYVGDWTWDVKAAKALGWKFVGIASGKEAEAVREAGAERVLPDFNGLFSELEEI